jgi:hypothetical protein
LDTVYYNQSLLFNYIIGQYVPTLTMSVSWWIFVKMSFFRVQQDKGLAGAFKASGVAGLKNESQVAY